MKNKKHLRNISRKHSEEGEGTMLVQKQKSKKQHTALFNKLGLSPPHNISSAMIAGLILPDNEDKNKNCDEHIDEKYRDFHRNRQSEKVLRVIRSVLEENRGSFTKSNTTATVAATADGKKEGEFFYYSVILLF